MTVTCKVLIGSGKLPAITSSCNFCVRTPSCPVSGDILHGSHDSACLVNGCFCLVLQTFFQGCLSVHGLGGWNLQAFLWAEGCLLADQRSGRLLPPCCEDQGPSAATQAAGGWTVHRDCSSSPWAWREGHL